MTKPPVPTNVMVARVLLCTAAGMLVILAAVFTILFLGFAAMCTDPGNTDQCPEAVSMALTPAVIAIPCALLAIIAVWCTRKLPVIWTSGVVLLATGVALPIVFLYT